MVTKKINSALVDLRNEIQSLMQQNANIKLLLDEENNKSIKLTKQLCVRRPFNQTKTGEIIFPGKKEMELKLDIMTREIFKFKSVLDGFKKDEIDKTREIIKSNCNLKHYNDNDDDTNEQLQNTLNELNEKYKTIDNEFDQVVLDVSKYRVKLEKAKKQLHHSEKQLQKIQLDFNEVSSQIATIERNIRTDDNSKEKLTSELDKVKSHLDDLKSIMVYQMDEINDKNESYMNALHVKEYQMFRANNLCKEKARLTASFETQFDQIKEYFKKRLDHICHLPTALQAAQEKLATQKKIRTSIEETIEILQKKLKTIMANEDIGGNSAHKLKELEKLKAKNIRLKSKLETMKKASDDIQSRYAETKLIINQQKSRLDEVITEKALKINKTRVFLNGLTEEYLITIDKLQNEVSKLEAASCFENDTLTIVSSMMQKQVDSLSNIFKNAQEQVMEIKNLQDCYKNTQIDVCQTKLVS